MTQALGVKGGGELYWPWYLEGLNAWVKGFFLPLTAPWV